MYVSKCFQLQETKTQIKSGLNRRKLLMDVTGSLKVEQTPKGDSPNLPVFLCFWLCPPACSLHPPATSEMSLEFSVLTPTCNHEENKKETVFPGGFLLGNFLPGPQQTSSVFHWLKLRHVPYSQINHGLALTVKPGLMSQLLVRVGVVELM